MLLELQWMFSTLCILFIFDWKHLYCMHDGMLIYESLNKGLQIFILKTFRKKLQKEYNFFRTLFEFFGNMKIYMEMYGSYLSSCVLMISNKHTTIIHLVF